MYLSLKNHFGEDIVLQNCWITLELLTHRALRTFINLNNDQRILNLSVNLD